MDAVRVTLLREVLTGTEWLEATRSFAGSLRGSVARSPRGGGGLLLVGTETYEPWHLAAHLDDEAVWSGLPALSPTLVRCRVPERAPAHLAVGLDRLEAVRRGETVLVTAPEQTGERLLERVHDARRGGATVLALESGDTELRSLAHDVLYVPGSLPEVVPPRLATDLAGGPAPGPGPDRVSGPGARRAAGGPAGPADASAITTAGAFPTGAAGGFADAAPGGPVFEVFQHLVSAAAGEARPGAAAGRAARFRDRLSRLAEQLTAPPATRW